MQHEVTPEPSPDEREALERVLRTLDGDEPAPYRSAWRRAGLDLSDLDDATARRGRSRAAPRA